MKKSLTKCLSSDKKEFSDHRWMRHAIILLWALLAHPLAKSHREEVLFEKPVNEIELYLNNGEISVIKKNQEEKEELHSRCTLSQWPFSFNLLRNHPAAPHCDRKQNGYRYRGQAPKQEPKVESLSTPYGYLLTSCPPRATVPRLR